MTCSSFSPFCFLQLCFTLFFVFLVSGEVNEEGKGAEREISRNTDRGRDNGERISLLTDFARWQKRSGPLTHTPQSDPQSLLFIRRLWIAAVLVGEPLFASQKELAQEIRLPDLEWRSKRSLQKEHPMTIGVPQICSNFLCSRSKAFKSQLTQYFPYYGEGGVSLCLWCSNHGYFRWSTHSLVVGSFVCPSTQERVVKLQVSQFLL